jgi:hypothetical protein
MRKKKSDAQKKSGAPKKSGARQIIQFDRRNQSKRTHGTHN